MSSNTENTEAKLAAYIDGQLDPAERAQIEQYLQSNPEHRKLLADLIAQRETLRSLPREKAPPDVYDAIQAQLERSVLLDDSAASAAPVLRHSRRSQLFGLAAMLLLAVGLGVVLYFALPSTKPHPIDVASTAGSAASQPTTSSTPDADLDTYLSADNAATAKRHAKTRPNPAEGLATLNDSAGAALGKRTRAARTQPHDLANATAGMVASAATPSPGTPGQVVLLVSTNDPSKVNQQVELYLQSNHIRWEAVRAPADQVLYSRTITATPTPTQKAEAVSPDETKLAAPAPAAAGTERSSAETPQPPTTSESPAGQPESHDAQPEQQKQEAFSPTTTESLLAQESPSPTTQPQPAATPGDQAAPRPSYIVARGMTRDQAIELTDALSVDRTTQRARLIGRLPAELIVAEPPKVQRAELKLSQVQPIPQTQPTTNPATVATSAPAIAENPLPTTQPSANLEKQADAKFEQFAAAAPTTAPAEKTSLFATTAPATQPAGPTVDVVILVEDDSPSPAPAPAAPATSQPAPASQPAPPAD